MDRRIGPQVPKLIKPKMAASNKPMQLPKIENKIVDDEWRIYDNIEPPDTLTEDDFEYFQFIDREKRKREKMVQLRDEQEVERYREIRKNLVVNSQQTQNFDKAPDEDIQINGINDQDKNTKKAAKKRKGIRIIKKIEIQQEGQPDPKKLKIA